MTHFFRFLGISPSVFQPNILSISIDNPRRTDLRMGVSNMVRCIEMAYIRVGDFSSKIGSINSRILHQNTVYNEYLLPKNLSIKAAGIKR